MKITRLDIENFMPITEAHLALDERGLVNIEGDNRDDPSADSNGSGKSSIPDALSWVAYGVTARGVSGDDVINRAAGKGTRVSMTVLDDDGVFEIVRHRKHKKGRNRVHVFHRHEGDATWNDLTKGTDKLTQALINQILGASVEVFNAAVYAGQEAMPDLPAMTDKQLKALVEEAAGIDRLQRGYDVARQRLRTVEQQHDRQASAIEAHKGALERMRTDVTETEKRAKGWAHDQQNRVRGLAQAIKALKKSIDTAKSDMDEDRAAEVERLIADCDARLDAVKGEETERSRLQSAFETARDELSSANRMLSHQRKNVEGARHERDHVDDRVGKECGECGKTYEKGDLDAARAAAKRLLAYYVDEYKSAKAEAERAQSECDECEKRLREHVERMTDVSETVARRRELERERKAIEAEREEIADMDRQLGEKARRLRELREEVNPYTEVVDDLKRRAGESEEELRTMEAKRVELEDELAAHRAAVEVFGPAGVRAHILDTVTPFLNDRTSHYLGTLSDGQLSAVWSTLAETTKGELRERFNIDVTSVAGATGFAGLSGGQKRKVRLATAMALQDLVASRATKPIGLFIADEVDHALDNAGLERLMDILSEKARERGTVLAISHNSLSDWIREQVSVVLEGGSATITGCLNVEDGPEREVA